MPPLKKNLTGYENGIRDLMYQNINSNHSASGREEHAYKLNTMCFYTYEQFCEHNIFRLNSTPHFSN